MDFTYLNLSVIILVCGIVGALANIGSAMTQSRAVDSVVVTHLVFGAMYVLGGLGTLISGIILILQYIKL